MVPIKVDLTHLFPKMDARSSRVTILRRVWMNLFSSFLFFFLFGFFLVWLCCFL